jgi:hypothetical protein
VGYTLYAKGSGRAHDGPPSSLANPIKEDPNMAKKSKGGKKPAAKKSATKSKGKKGSGKKS